MEGIKWVAKHLLQSKSFSSFARLKFLWDKAKALPWLAAKLL